MLGVSNVNSAVVFVRKISYISLLFVLFHVKQDFFFNIGLFIMTNSLCSNGKISPLKSNTGNK